MSRLQSDKSNLNAALKMMRIDFEKRISDLIKDRDLLQARYKQLQNSIAQQKSVEEVDEQEQDDGQYEVDRLLDDKMVRTREYLVRWKGYDSSHDCWVCETDLDCPSILKKYKSTK